MVDAPPELDFERSSWDEAVRDVLMSDIEAQTLLFKKDAAPPVLAIQAAEYVVPIRIKLFHLGVYSILNLSLTPYNKAIWVASVSYGL